MDRLEQIKNTVTANGMREWTDERVGQAMREYATEMVRHNLERAAEKAQVTATGNYVLSYEVDKQSITSLEIELI